MEYKKAEVFAEAVLMARKDILKGIKEARAQQNARRCSWDKMMGAKDPTAKQAVARMSPLPILRCISQGQTFLIEWPEKWMQAIDEAFKLYKQRFGDQAVETMEHRYIQGWNVNKIVSVEGISKNHYQGRRREFLHCLLLKVVQLGLAEID